jgi:hypothetical protein
MEKMGPETGLRRKAQESCQALGDHEKAGREPREPFPELGMDGENLEEEARQRQVRGTDLAGAFPQLVLH